MSPGAEAGVEGLEIGRAQLRAGLNPHLFQRFGHFFPDSAKRLHRCSSEKDGYVLGTNHRQPVRFFHVGGQFGQQFIGRHPYRTGQSNFPMNGGLECRPALSAPRCIPPKPRVRYVEKGFIDGRHFHTFRKGLEHRENFPGRVHIVREPTFHRNQLGTKRPRPGQDHPRFDPKGAGLIGSCQNNPPPPQATDDNNSLSPQFWPSLLLNRREKSVHIHMQNDAIGGHRAQYHW